MKSRLLVIPVLASLLLGACTIPLVGNTVENVKQAADDKALEQEMLKNCTHDKEVCKYLAASVTSMSKPMITNSETQIKGFGKSISKSISDGKGNMQIISYKDGKEEGNMIVLDKSTYTKEYKNNYWLEMKSEEGDTNSSVDMKQVAEDFYKNPESKEIKDDTFFNKIGQEACGSLTCLKYKMGNKSSPDDAATVWFDTKEYLPRKMEFTSAETTSVITYEYTNVPAITKPSPVKEFKLEEMDSLYEGKTGVPSQTEIDKMLQELPAMDNQPGEVPVE